MSAQDWFQWVAALALFVCAFNVATLMRVTRLQHDQIRRLTRRVWILEGSPPCNHDSTEVEV